MHSKDIQEAAQKLSEGLADAGKIVEGGWEGFRLIVIPPHAPEAQVTEMRKAFFAGAQHLFTSIMSILDPGSEPTERDLQRMILIHTELESFGKDFELKYRPTTGTA